MLQIIVHSPGLTDWLSWVILYHQIIYLRHMHSRASSLLSSEWIARDRLPVAVATAQRHTYTHMHLRFSDLTQIVQMLAVVTNLAWVSLTEGWEAGVGLVLRSVSASARGGCCSPQRCHRLPYTHTKKEAVSAAAVGHTFVCLIWWKAKCQLSVVVKVRLPSVMLQCLCLCALPDKMSHPAAVCHYCSSRVLPEMSQNIWFRCM